MTWVRDLEVTQSSMFKVRDQQTCHNLPQGFLHPKSLMNPSLACATPTGITLHLPWKKLAASQRTALCTSCLTRIGVKHKTPPTTSKGSSNPRSYADFCICFDFPCIAAHTWLLWSKFKKVWSTGVGPEGKLQLCTTSTTL